MMSFARFRKGDFLAYWRMLRNHAVFGEIQADKMIYSFQHDLPRKSCWSLVSCPNQLGIVVDHGFWPATNLRRFGKRVSPSGNGALKLLTETSNTSKSVSCEISSGICPRNEHSFKFREVNLVKEKISLGMEEENRFSRRSNSLRFVMPRISSLILLTPQFPTIYRQIR